MTLIADVVELVAKYSFCDLVSKYVAVRKSRCLSRSSLKPMSRLRPYGVVTRRPPPVGASTRATGGSALFCAWL